MSYQRKLARSRWRNMMQRCYDKNHPKYPRYGGRGIRVDKRWHDFEVYFADTGSPSALQMTLDRPDNDKSYGPDNWRWATVAEQNANRGTYSVKHTVILHKGKPISRGTAAKALGCKKESVYRRMKQYKDKGVDQVSLTFLIKQTKLFRVPPRKSVEND